MSKKRAKIRLYVDAELNTSGEILLNDKQAHYLTNVMKLGNEDEVLAFNNRQGEFLCALQSKSKKEFYLKVLSQTRLYEQCPNIWLLFAPVKKDQTDFIIQKATELGVSKIIPVITAHTISDKVKRERFVAQSIEAAEQCRRVDLPEILEAQTLEKVLNSWDKERILYFMDETRQAQPANKVFDAKSPKAAVFVGPEGGFSEDELNLLRSLPFAKGATLGKRILRAETAVAAALSVWQTLAGDWREE